MPTEIDSARREVDTLRILIVEDNPDDAEILKCTLEAQGVSAEVLVVATRKAFEQAASDRDNPVDVILADYSLPQFTAVDAIRFLRTRELDTPLVVVTGFLSSREAVKLVHREGAAWWAMKSDLSGLGETVRMVIEQQQRTRETQQLTEFARALVENEGMRERWAQLEEDIERRWDRIDRIITEHVEPCGDQ